MFTGIVEEIGEITGIRPSADVVTLAIHGPAVAIDLAHGDSVSVNGCCLTVVDRQVDAEGVFHLELVPETLKRTSLGAATAGAKVNLERAVRVDGRLGGHIVQGHVDGVGTVLRRVRGERSDEVTVSLPAELSRYVVEKGSITVDGVSLTVAATDADTFTVALIPTTLEDTTLGIRGPGDVVNIEVDVVAKYLERLAVGYLGHTDAYSGEEARS